VSHPIVKLLYPLVIGVILYFLLNGVVTDTQARLLAVVVVLVIYWTNEAMPLGVVAMIPIIIFPSLDILSTNATTANYSKSIIFLFLGGFMIAIAVQKIGLHKIIANKLLGYFPQTPKGLILALSVTSALMSSFLSNTTTTLLLIPIALFLTEIHELKLRFALAIAYGANIGGIITPIGTAPNLILLGFLESQGVEPISFVNWIILTLPLALVMLYLIAQVLSYKAGHFELTHELETNITLTSEQKRLTFILISLVVLLLVNSPIKPYYDGLGINEKGILLFFGLILFIPKFGMLTWEDSKKIPYEIIFLFGAGFSIAAAFTQTELAQVVAGGLKSYADLTPILLLGLVSLFVVFSTEITSNTALTSVAIPIIYTLGVEAGFDSTLILLVATISASYAFMLPIATPPNAIAMSSGVVKIKEMMSYGFVINIIGVIMVTLFGYFYWSWILGVN
jgi:sodium-dependent dicarboxylate transporter 2/3/5